MDKHIHADTQTRVRTHLRFGRLHADHQNQEQSSSSLERVCVCVRAVGGG